MPGMAHLKTAISILMLIKQEKIVVSTLLAFCRPAATLS